MTTRTWLKRCLGEGCSLPIVATFGRLEEFAACGQHVELAIEEYDLPTVVIDWEAVDADLFDPQVLAAQVDEAVSMSPAWSIDEVFAADLPHVLGEVLSVTSSADWPNAVPDLFEPRPGPKPVDALWHRKVLLDPHDAMKRVEVPLTRNSHGLPLELLGSVADAVTEERSKALLCDVLWCATRNRSYALRAIDAHHACAADPDVAAAHRSVDPGIHFVDPVEDDRERDRATRRFQLSHLRRAVALSQVMNETDRLTALNDHGRSLVQTLSSDESAFEVLEAVGPHLGRVPDWWDGIMEAELLRIGILPNAPREPFLDLIFDMAANRALACKDPDLASRHRAAQIAAYWRALDLEDENGLTKGEWARHAHELAERYAPDLVNEARRRFDAIDRKGGMTVHRMEVELPPEIGAWRRSLVQCVERLPDTLQRLELFASSVTLFTGFYVTSDQFVNTPFGNSITTISLEPMERVAATAAQREAHSRSEQVRRSLLHDLRLFGAPVVARILELFDPEEPWSTGFEFFDDVARRRLRRCIELCVAEDFDTAAHLLAPLSERVVKRAVRDIGLRPVVPAPSAGGKAMPGTLGTLLIGLSTTSDLPHDLLAGLLFVLTSDVPTLGDDTGVARPVVDGLNLRNEIAHGEGEESIKFSAALMLLLCASALGGLVTVEGELHRRSFDLAKLMDVLGIDPTSFVDA